MIISRQLREVGPGFVRGQVYEPPEDHGTFVMKIPDRLAKIPRFAKILIPLQTLLNLLLASWIYEEYANNRYFRSYLSSSLQAGASAAIVLGSTGLLVIAALGLYAKLRGYRRELGMILSTETFRPVEEGLVLRSIRKLRNILSRLFRRLRRS
jgi:hypothetical protein